MTTPNDPTNPEGTPPPPGYGTPPAYGTPSGYGAPGGAAPYGGAELASWFARVGGTLIDALIIIVPAGIIGLITKSMPLYQLIALAGGLYFAFLNGSTGQTPGKKALGIKVLKEADGQLLGGGMGIVRYLAHILDAISCAIGYLWPLWDSKKQTFADKVMGTVVIKVPSGHQA